MVWRKSRKLPFLEHLKKYLTGITFDKIFRENNGVTSTLIEVMAMPLSMGGTDKCKKRSMSGKYPLLHVCI